MSQSLSPAEAAGHMRDAMLPELTGTGVFTNRCGAGRLLLAESSPFGSCARLDYVLVPRDSTVTHWHVPNDLDHCSDTHSPVLATIRYQHPKGSGARRCAARDNAADDPDRAFQFLGPLSGADLRKQMGECSARWAQLAQELDSVTVCPSQTEMDRLWSEGVLQPAAELGERARTASRSRPSSDEPRLGRAAARRTGGQGPGPRSLCPESSAHCYPPVIHVACLSAAPSLRFQPHKRGARVA